MQLQKEVKSNQKQCAALKKAIVKKDWKSKVAAKKLLANGKSFNNSNSSEFDSGYWIVPEMHAAT